MNPPGIHRLATELPAGAGRQALDGLLAATARPQTLSGRPIAFVDPPDDGEGYEARIWRTGAVATRRDNEHDLFNALAWLNFPRTKAMLNARHVAALHRPGAGSRRDAERDALTHFDECGAIVVSRDPELLDLLRQFRWRRLFCERRDDVIDAMVVVVFGHATLAALRAPFRGLTAKAVLESVPAEWFGQSLAERIADLDRRLSTRFGAPPTLSTRDLQPLPLLGWPGVVAASEDPAYYDDSFQFRSGRIIRPAKSARQPPRVARHGEESPGSTGQGAG